ncbi:MAG: hypothetical protein Q9216_004737 [Gyalolechia sp. 2 TL-2023]
MGPVVGVLADNSRSKYGRRRPFMIGGAIIVSLGLLVLGWTTEIVGFFIPESEDADAKSGAWKLFAKILSTAWHLPDRIRAICWVQFWAWIGWFPFLFYSTTWVGETYFRYTPEASITESSDPLGDIGRIGSLSLLIFSIVTFIGSVLLPFVVRSPDNEAKSGQRSFTPRPPPVLAPLAAFSKGVKPDLLTSWMLSHLIFAGAMFLAPFVRSLHMATVLVSICGIPWALACWAPFAYMGIEVNRMTAPSTILANGSSYRRLPTPSDDFSSPGPSPNFLRLNHLDRDIDDDEDSDNSTGETAGIYLGILNLFTTLPQFVGTFISMIVFEILEPGKHPELHKGEDVDGEAKDEVVKKVTEGPNAIAVCLFIGAISAVGAAYATGRMKKMYKRP